MYLVFDIGGTNMRLSISSDGQTIANTKIVPTPQDFEQALKVFKSTAEQLLNSEKIESIAGGIAGPLDKDKSMLIHSPHLPSWVNKPLKQNLESLFNCPVYLENDSALGALGEAVYGVGKGYSIVAYLNIGTGIGGARIVDSKIDKNALGFEPGHQIIVPDGNLCNCGGKGHLETYIGGSYIERIYQKKGEEIKDPQIWDEISKYLAIGLHNTIVHWSPDMVILGGSVSSSIPIDRVNAHLKEVMTIFPKSPEIVKSSLGKETGAFGALALIHSV